MRTSTLSLSFITSLFLVGCGSSYSDSDNSYTQSEIQKTSLQSSSRNVQYLISGSNSLSLYEFDKDTTLSVSNCSTDDAADGTVDGQSCIDRWPIYITTDSNLTGDFNFATPHANQATYKKHPIYYWFKDALKGDITGDKIKNVWHLIYPNNDFVPSTVATKLSSDYRAQEYLTSNTSYALYTFDNDDVNMSNCYDGCAAIWPPYTAKLDTSSLPTGIEARDLSTIERSDGLTQVTYKGQALYYYKLDTKITDTNGDWIKGVWHLIELSSSATSVTQAPVADLTAGQTKFTDCANCHGVDGKSSAFGISILLADDIDTAKQAEDLLNFMRTDGTGKNATMVSIAQGLSDKEVIDVSAYIETLN